jgi:predicted dienelactone hydrolase
MKKIVLWTLGSLAILIVALFGAFAATSTKTGPLPELAAGYHVTQMPAPRRGDAPLTLTLWYPAKGDQPITLIGQNALFYGFHGRVDAQGDGQPRPVVVLSHGSGGNAQRLGWIGSYLAEKGFIVAAVNHVGTTSQDSLPSRTVHPWERTGDVSDILDFLQTSPPLGLRPDLARVGILGFSLGGGTALLSGGAMLLKDAFVNYCADVTGKADCTWLQAGGVDFTAIDAAKYQADMRDPRIDAVVAVDPALTQAMTPASLAAMTLPTQIINLGAGDGIPLATMAQDAAGRIPNAGYTQIAGAAHFSFLARCSTFGVIMISVAGDDNICSDRGLRPRDVVQKELQAEIGSFFQMALLLP